MKSGNEGGNRMWKWSVVWVLLWSFGTEPVGGATKYFSHGVVGGDASLGVRLRIEIQQKRKLGKAPSVISEGELRFYDQQGNAQKVIVTGEEYDRAEVEGIKYELNRLTGKIKSTYEVESSGSAVEVFWVGIEEQVGEVTGTLTFQLEGEGKRITDATVFAREGEIVHVTPAIVAGADKTGVAVANPTDEDLMIQAIAVDKRGQTWQKSLELKAKRQEALYVDQLFSELSDESEESDTAPQPLGKLSQSSAAAERLGVADTGYCARSGGHGVLGVGHNVVRVHRSDAWRSLLGVRGRRALSSDRDR